MKNDKTCKHSQYIWYMLWIMYYSGCRTAEALALSASDYDKNILHINKSIGSTVSETRQIVPTKTAGSVRDIPCVPELDNLINLIIEYSSTSPLLTYDDGKPN